MGCNIDDLRINQHNTNKTKPLDKRIKLTDSQKEEIREKYFTAKKSEQPSMSKLARDYGVDRRLIQFILFPEREKRQRELDSIRQKDGRYYDKDKHLLKTRKHRQYKRELYEKGLLSLEIKT